MFSIVEAILVFDKDIKTALHAKSTEENPMMQSFLSVIYLFNNTKSTRLINLIPSFRLICLLKYFTFNIFNDVIVLILINSEPLVMDDRKCNPYINSAVKRSLSTLFMNSIITFFINCSMPFFDIIRFYLDILVASRNRIGIF